MLVSDRLETCDADPGAVAGELAQSGSDFKLQVIGFGLHHRDQDRSRCLADDTDGQFLPSAHLADTHGHTGAAAELRAPKEPGTSEARASRSPPWEDARRV